MKLKKDGAITGGQIGPVPVHGESQQTFMDRCMLDPTMIDDYPTVGDRTTACSVQWGKGATPETKDDKKMGECKGCGKKMDLDKDGYCNRCAEEMTDDDDGRPGKPKQPKSGKPNTSKSGRVLSQRNFDALGDVMADLKEAADMDGTPRAAKALIRSGMSKIKSVLDAATPETPDDVTPKAPTDEDVLHAAVLLAATNRGARDHMKEMIETLNLGDEHVQIAEDYAALTTSTG